MYEINELYNLEFRFLPEIFGIYEKTKTNPGINIDEEKLTDIEFIRSYYKSNFINWNEFKFEKKELQNNVKEFIYNFGVPKDYTLCHFAIFYVDEANKIYKYFTLEKTVDFCGNGNNYPVVCGQKGPSHLNYGIKCPPNLESFEEVIQSIINNKK